MKDNFYELMVDPEDETAKCANTGDDYPDLQVDEDVLRNAAAAREKNQQILYKNEQKIRAHFCKKLENFYTYGPDTTVLEKLEEFINQACEEYNAAMGDTTINTKIDDEIIDHFKFLFDYPMENWRTYFKMVKDNDFVAEMLCGHETEGGIKDVLAAIGRMVIVCENQALPLDDLQTSDNFLRLLEIYRYKLQTLKSMREEEAEAAAKAAMDEKISF